MFSCHLADVEWMTAANYCVDIDKLHVHSTDILITYSCQKMYTLPILSD